ncbi:hypothetical protein B0H14DRAFT_2615046 [Mycena olivaceomarginata]|nr:hypothetical protein B0H14DRAFT_2615046 [Mycena olivaceomarginata]
MLRRGGEILPRTVGKIASNQGTASETASVMGTQRKGGKKRKNVDPYGAGQTSGKSAQPDARTGKKARTSPSASEDTECLDFDDFDDLMAPGLSLSPVPIVSSPPAVSSPQHVESTAPPPIMPPASTGDSPQAVLMNIMAQYNTMFPPDIPQRTSYYRENTYLPTTAGSYYRTR